MKIPAIFAEFPRCSLVVVLAPRPRHALNFGKTHSAILPVSFPHWYYSGFAASKTLKRCKKVLRDQADITEILTQNILPLL